MEARTECRRARSLSREILAEELREEWRLPPSAPVLAYGEEVEGL